MVRERKKRHQFTEAAPPVVDNYAIDSGYPDAVTPAMLADMTPVSMADFATGLQYQYPRKIGTVNVGTSQAPVWEARYQMIPATVNEATSSADLAKFNNAMKYGAYLPVVAINSWNVTVTTTTTNFAAVITITNPLKLSIDWGDGTPVDSSGLGTHTYVAIGTYVIKLSGTMGAGGNIRFGKAPATLGAVLTATSVIDAGIADFTNTFSSCNFTTIPSGLFDKCPLATSFQGCFALCSQLTSIPSGLFDKNINVTTFQGVINGTAITTIPSGIFDKCPLVTTFQSLCLNCSQLTSIPSGLFDKNINVTTFGQAFQGCAALASIPTGLFANCPFTKAFNNTFYGCVGLTGNIPSGLFASCPLVTTFAGTFQSCTGITAIPTGLFANNNLATTFKSTFNACSKIVSSIPAGLFDNKPLVTDFSATFFGCSGIIGSIPNNLFDSCIAATTFATTFQNCTGITAIPTGLFANCNNVTSFTSVFLNCSNITGTLDINFFNLTAPTINFANVFKGCTNLIGTAPTLWVTYPAATSIGCFNGCTLLTNYAAIPAGWK